jgi:hypothetical protein
MSARTFHLGAILTVTTDRLVAPGHIGDVYEILNWMTGDNLVTHQLGRAAAECKPDLLRQYPDLADVVVPETFGAEEHVRAWLAEQVAALGETRDVAPLAPGVHVVIDPVTELRAMRPDAPIIVIGDGS